MVTTNGYALEIRDTAKNSIGSQMPAKSLELQHTIRLIRELNREIDEIEEQIQSIMDELHSPITTIPGLGFRMAAMILLKSATSPALTPRTSCWLMPGCPPQLTSPDSSKIATHTWKSAVHDICATLFTMQPSTSVSGTRHFLLISPRNGRRASITTLPFPMQSKSWFG